VFEKRETDIVPLASGRDFAALGGDVEVRQVPRAAGDGEDVEALGEAVGGVRDKEVTEC
jgi:hypothetical protein